jgi:addiction module HigA family antidote
MMATKQVPIRFAVPPGQIIRSELEARGWSQERLAAEMGRPYQAINAIVNGHKAITADTAIELGDAFGTSAVYWMNLEAAYQLYKAHQKRKAIAGAKLAVNREAPFGASAKTKQDTALIDASVIGEPLKVRGGSQRIAATKPPVERNHGVKRKVHR